MGVVWTLKSGITDNKTFIVWMRRAEKRGKFRGKKGRRLTSYSAAAVRYATTSTTYWSTTMRERDEDETPTKRAFHQKSSHQSIPTPQISPPLPLLTHHGFGDRRIFVDEVCNLSEELNRLQ